MSDKTFLQELQSIKHKIELLEESWAISDDTSEDIEEIKEDVQRMISQCLEIQLAMMKQGNVIDAKGR